MMFVKSFTDFPKFEINLGKQIRKLTFHTMNIEFLAFPFVSLGLYPNLHLYNITLTYFTLRQYQITFREGALLSKVNVKIVKTKYVSNLKCKNQSF